MNKIERTEYIRKLKEHKEALERELKTTCEEIKNQEDHCKHVTAKLGYNDNLLLSEARCLICGKTIENPLYRASAEKYLPHFDTSIAEESEHKYEIIQTLMLGIIKENPEMSEEEIINRLNDIFNISQPVDPFSNIHNSVIKEVDNSPVEKIKEIDNSPAVKIKEIDNSPAVKVKVKVIDQQ